MPNLIREKCLFQGAHMPHEWSTSTGYGVCLGVAAVEEEES